MQVKQKVELSSEVFMWIAFGFGILSILMMFTPCLSIPGKSYSFANIFFVGDTINSVGVWPVFIGYMLIAVGILATGFMALPFIRPSRKTEMIVLLGSIVLFIVAALLIILANLEYVGLNHITKDSGGYNILGGAIASFIFIILSAACNALAAKLDW